MAKIKIPMRKCLVSNQILPKKELIRIVYTKDKDIFVDLTGKANGKGAYIQKKTELILLLSKNKVLERTFKTTITKEMYEQLIEEIMMYQD